MQKDNKDAYIYTSKPKPLVRAKYRDEAEQTAQGPGVTITFDPRVRRGITVGKPVQLAQTIAMPGNYVFKKVQDAILLVGAL
jgi:hypothetical protein